MNTSGASAATMAAQKSVVDRIIGIFTAPRAAMEDIVARPTWLVPFIILAVFAMGSAYLLMDVGMQAAIEQMQNNPKMTQEQIDMATKAMEGRMASPLRYLGVAVPPIGILVVWVIIAGVFMFSGNVVMGGEAKFKTIFAVLAWSGLIGALSTLVNTPIMLSKQSIEASTSLSVLLSPDAKNTFLYKLLGHFEIFTIWEVVVMSIGLAVAYKFSTGKAAGIVIAWWVIWILISTAFSSLFGGMMFGG